MNCKLVKNVCQENCFKNSFCSNRTPTKQNLLLLYVQVFSSKYFEENYRSHLCSAFDILSCDVLIEYVFDFNL